MQHTGRNDDDSNMPQLYGNTIIYEFVASLERALASGPETVETAEIEMRDEAHHEGRRIETHLSNSCVR